MPDRPTRQARDEIAAAALGLLGEADAGDLLRALTPERLAAQSGRSASTVRYHFGGDDADGGGTYAFQRRDLALAVLARALEGRVDASAASAPAYRAAADALPGREDLAELYAAIADTLAPFIPGPSGDDAAARERVHHIGLAICDTDAAAARLLREARTRQLELFVPVIEDVVRATGRELVPGRTMTELVDTVLTLLDGHLLRLRFDPGASGGGVDAAVTAIFATFTRAAGREAFDAEAEVLGRRRPG